MQVLSRTEQQEKIMQIMSSFLVCQKEGLVLNVEETIKDVIGVDYSNVPIYVKEVLIKALKHQNEIILDISKYLKNWTFSRLNTCIQAILIIAYTNYYYIKDDNMNKAIIINIAIELAKKYAEKDEYKFVNGILENCLKEENKSEWWIS